MSDETIDLSKLSETELHILRLFAQGHTAKSVATATERSVGAVNERLREARRKTGIASSRELARLLAAQEIRDEKIDIDQRDEGDPDGSSANASKPWPWLAGGTFIMIAIALVGAVLAGTTLMQSTPETPAQPVPIDPAVVSMASSMSPGEQYRQIRAEARDAAWAAPAERFLAGEYEKILHSRGVKDNPKIYCAATICEVTLRASITDAQATALTEDFQKWSFADKLAAHGYVGKTAGFGGDKSSDGPAFIYFSYWTKAGSDNEKRPR